MSNSLNQIRLLDTTLEKSSTLSTTPILNTLEAVRECLLYGEVQLRVAAVSETLKHGDLGLDLLLNGNIMSGYTVPMKFYYT